jgi:hypothetical protein
MSVAHLADLQLIKDDSMAVVLLAYGIFGLLLAGSGFLGAKKPLC